ncbi:MAG: amidohydrolase family protein [Ignisphaera sp.]|nr:amidohydrolase family protein [Ignisphaera sp.]
MPSTNVIALTGLRVVKGTGEHPIENGVIVIEGRRIRDVGTQGSVEVPPDARIVDLKGFTALPGLIDAHMHLLGLRSLDMVKEPLLVPYATRVARVIQDLKALIEAGFTTVVDAGSDIGVYIKQAIAEGTVIGPRVVSAGYVISQTFGHGDTHYLPIEYADVRTTKLRGVFSVLCDGVDECRKAARYVLREGADFIKIMASGGVLSEKDRPEYRQFTVEEIRAIVEEAEAAGRWVHAHAQGSKGIINAVKAGVKVIAHAIYIDEEGIELAKQRNVVVVPTFAIVDQMIRFGEELGTPRWGLEKAREVYEIHIENIRKAYRAGVKLATGTDFAGGVKALRHGDNAIELQLFVEKLGMTPLEAITCATRNAAEATGLAHTIGSIEKGKVADIIIVKGNPVDDIRVLLNKDNIVLVFKEGEVVKNMISSESR